MFHYYPVEDAIQERQKCTPISGYLRILYDDPAPVLSNWKPKPVLVTSRYREYAERVKQFPIRNSDVWILSYPKTGTNLTVEMVQVLHNGMVENEDLLNSVPFLELNSLTLKVPVDILNKASTRPDPRLIRTHLQINLLPKDLLTSKAKIIYVVRNPKDTAISFYHHHMHIDGWLNNDLRIFLEDFLTGNIIFDSYFSHVEEYLQLAKLMDNVLVLKYEDIVTDTKSVVSTVSKFLEMSYTDDEVAAIADYLHFDKMKIRRANNKQPEHFNETAGKDFKFMRKGKVGSSKDEMPMEFHERFEKETRKWKLLSELYPY